MKMQSDPLRTEGDINLSPVRKGWQDRHIDEETRAILAEDEQYFLHQSMSTPCLNVITKCEGIYLTDTQGRKVMDFHGNNVHQVGFGHPHVIAAVKEQLDELSFSTRRYTNRKAIELAKRLAELAPGTLNRVLLAPGATSAVGMALKLARIATGKYKVASMWDSFHGASLDAISVGGEAVFRRGMGPLLPGVIHVPPVNTYRGMFGESVCDDIIFARHLEYVMEKDGEIGAVIIETVRNTDVQIPSKEYLQAVRELCDCYGALLILDETAIAFGRTGKMFAFEHYDIVPDMVVVGKGLGGGVFPIAALIAKEELNLAQHISLGHYTHEKSPVGAAAALAMLEVLEMENLLARVEEMSPYIRVQLSGLMEEVPLIGDIRGIGLLFGVELVKDRISKEPAVEEAERVMYHCLEQGLSFKVSQGNVLQLSPPLIIEQGEVDHALAILRSAFAGLA
ncbi:(R)-1-hydroxy-2-aminoethylphosphonate ammonia-lyase [Brevibacillus massiliensis]|jgi:4-aminobutyrate aminotransferase|uniref:(R)-1-hydroxy-2-aminoethylphosphonate ammonia-lyase n=1 Tax=Brevibacillus massiliensis TaxID=1118054 RepID=UPI0002EDCC36|nr:aspartate aminotransferase family protein [Brevibacillus massiliensis]